MRPTESSFTEWFKVRVSSYDSHIIGIPSNGSVQYSPLDVVNKLTHQHSVHVLVGCASRLASVGRGSRYNTTTSTAAAAAAITYPIAPLQALCVIARPITCIADGSTITA